MPQLASQVSQLRQSIVYVPGEQEKAGAHTTDDGAETIREMKGSSVSQSIEMATEALEDTQNIVAKQGALLLDLEQFTAVASLMPVSRTCCEEVQREASCLSWPRRRWLRRCLCSRSCLCAAFVFVFLFVVVFWCVTVFVFVIVSGFEGLRLCLYLFDARRCASLSEFVGEGVCMRRAVVGRACFTVLARNCFRDVLVFRSSSSAFAAQVGRASGGYLQQYYLQPAPSAVPPQAKRVALRREGWDLMVIGGVCGLLLILAQIVAGLNGQGAETFAQDDAAGRLMFCADCGGRVASGVAVCE